MSSTSVSVVLPIIGRPVALEETAGEIARFLESTGFAFEIIIVQAESQPRYAYATAEVMTVAGRACGSAIRRGGLEAKGSVVVIVDPELPYPVTAIGDAVAMIESGSTDVVFGGTSELDPETSFRHVLLRTFLVPILPDPKLQLKAFTSAAAHLLLGESRLAGAGCGLEIAFLANRYGLRVERLAVQLVRPVRLPRAFGPLLGLVDVMRIRMTDRSMGYRAGRRCPVCFSTEVWNWAQVPGNIVRACKRCKCRYLKQFAAESETEPVRRTPRAHPPIAEPEKRHDATAREKMSSRRLSAIRRRLTPRARLLEVGVADGSFGAAASREYEYVGIDTAEPAARAARARGLEVYCSSLARFVNTGPAFDAVALFHVFENLCDPHDALSRIKDLLKPGGVLFLTAFDTEGMLDFFSGRRQTVQNLRAHLILYSRSALIELLERSGFEILSIGPDLEYRDHRLLRHRLGVRTPRIAPLLRAILGLLPNPLPVSAGSIRIVAKRRAGPSVEVLAIRSVEPTHAR